MKNYKILIGLRITAMVLLFGTALGFVTMSLWNWLVPVLFHGPSITFWQAIGLFALSKILFSGFTGKGGRWGGRHPRNEYWRKRMEARMASMTEEEKEKFRNRCNWKDAQ
jgi:hypothetical protein